MGKVLHGLSITILVLFGLTSTMMEIYSMNINKNNQITIVTSDRILQIDTTGYTTLNPAVDSTVNQENIYVKPKNRNESIDGLLVSIKNTSNDTVEISHLTIIPLSVEITKIDTNEITLNRKLIPGSTISFSLSFKLTGGKNWATLITVNTKTTEKLPDSIQNPMFRIFGNTRIPVLSLSGVQNQNYAHFWGGDYKCNKPQTILLKNIGDAPFGIDSVKAEGGNFKNVDPLPTSKSVLFPNEETIITIYPKPDSAVDKNYNTTLVIYTNALNPIYYQPISFRTTFPKASISIRKDTLSTDTSLISNSKTLIEIPIFYSLSNVYSFKKLAFRLGFELPPESRKSIHLDTVSFVAGPDVVGDYTSTTSTLGNKSVDVNVQTTGAISTDKNSIQDALLGFLRFTYFLSEEKTSTIKINLFEIINDNEDPNSPSICNTLSMNNPQSISIKRLDDICLDSTFTTFMDLVRAKTNAFHASMQVSGEPVMEIQHFFKDPMHAEISLYSVNGMKLETVFSGLAPSDLHQFRHPMGHLTPGVYFCEMIAGPFRKTIPILLTR